MKMTQENKVKTVALDASSATYTYLGNFINQKSVDVEVIFTKNTITDIDFTLYQKVTKDVLFWELDVKTLRKLNFYDNSDTVGCLSNNTVYVYDATDTAADNGTTVIKPTGILQVDNILLDTGTAGQTGTILAGGLSKVATFATSYTVTAANFVTANAEAYAAVGIILTSSGANLIFTSNVITFRFTSPTITTITGLDGTVTYTPGNWKSDTGTEWGKYLATSSTGNLTASGSVILSLTDFAGRYLALHSDIATGTVGTDSATVQVIAKDI